MFKVFLFLIRIFYTLLIAGGGPRQAPKGGTLSHLAYSNLLHKILDVSA